MEHYIQVTLVEMSDEIMNLKLERNRLKAIIVSLNEEVERLKAPNESERSE